MTASEGTTPKPSIGERWARAAAVFLDPRVLIILLLGFSSGLPLALSASTLLLWMKDVGVDLKTIGLFALVGTPYTIKFLWAPLVDAFQIPVLGRVLGHRRGWLVFTQLLLIAALLFLGAQDPVASPWMVALAAVIVATASATQDIVIDAFRTEYLPTENQAAGMAYFVAAYRIGMLVSTAGIVALVAYLEFSGIDRGVIWFYGYAAMAALVLVGMAGALLAHEPQAKTRAAAAESGGRRRRQSAQAILRRRLCRLRRFSRQARRAADPVVRRLVQVDRHLRRGDDRAVRAGYRLRQGELCGDRQRRGPDRLAARRRRRRTARPRHAAVARAAGGAACCKRWRISPSPGSPGSG